MAVRHSIYSTKPDFLGVRDKIMCRTVFYWQFSKFGIIMYFVNCIVNSYKNI